MNSYNIIQPWLWLITESSSYDSMFYGRYFNVISYDLFCHPINNSSNNIFLLYYSNLNTYTMFTSYICWGGTTNLFEVFVMRNYFGDFIDLCSGTKERMVFWYECFSIFMNNKPLHIIEFPMSWHKRLIRFITLGMFNPWIPYAVILPERPVWTPHLVEMWSELTFKQPYFAREYTPISKTLNSMLLSGQYKTPIFTNWLDNNFCYYPLSNNSCTVSPYLIKTLSVSNFAHYERILQIKPSNDGLIFSFYNIGSFFVRYIYFFFAFLNSFIIDLNFYKWINHEFFIFDYTDKNLNFGWHFFNNFLFNLLHLKSKWPMWNWIMDFIDFYIPQQLSFTNLQDTIIDKNSSSFSWLNYNSNSEIWYISTLIYYFNYISFIIITFYYFAKKFRFVYLRIYIFGLRHFKRYSKRQLKKLWHRSFIYTLFYSGHYRRRRLNAIKIFALNETIGKTASAKDLLRDVFEWNIRYLFQTSYSRFLWISLAKKTRTFLFWQIINNYVYRKFFFYLYSLILGFLYSIKGKFVRIWMETGYFYFSTYIVYYIIYNVKINLRIDIYINLWLSFVKIKNFLLQILYLPTFFILALNCLLWWPQIPRYYQMQILEEYPVPHGGMFFRFFRYWKPIMITNLIGTYWVVSLVNLVQYCFSIVILWFTNKYIFTYNIIYYMWLYFIKIFLINNSKLLNLKNLLLFIFFMWFILIFKFFMSLILFIFFLVVAYNIINTYIFIIADYFSKKIMVFLLKYLGIFFWLIYESIRTIIYLFLISICFLLGRFKYIILIYVIYKFGLCYHSFSFLVNYVLSEYIVVGYFYDLNRLMIFWTYEIFFPLIVEPSVWYDNAKFLFWKEVRSVIDEITFLNAFHRVLFKGNYEIFYKLPFGYSIHFFIPLPKYKLIAQTWNPFLINIYAWYFYRWTMYEWATFMIWMNKTPLVFLLCQKYTFFVYVYYFLQAIKHFIVLSLWYQNIFWFYFVPHILISKLQLHLFIYPTLDIILFTPNPTFLQTFFRLNIVNIIFILKFSFDFCYFCYLYFRFYFFDIFLIIIYKYICMGIYIYCDFMYTIFYYTPMSIYRLTSIGKGFKVILIHLSAFLFDIINNFGYDVYYNIKSTATLSNYVLHSYSHNLINYFDYWQTRTRINMFNKEKWANPNHPIYHDKGFRLWYNPRWLFEYKRVHTQSFIAYTFFIENSIYWPSFIRYNLNIKYILYYSLININLYKTYSIFYIFLSFLLYFFASCINIHSLDKPEYLYNNEYLWNKLRDDSLRSYSKKMLRLVTDREQTKLNEWLSKSGEFNLDTSWNYEKRISISLKELKLFNLIVYFLL